MTRIVYASDSYTPPPGVVVMPLHEHPAIVEDAQRNQQKQQYRRRIAVRPRPLTQQIIEYLTTHHDGTVQEIALNLSQTKNIVRCALNRHPELFEPVGEQVSDKKYLKIVWGLVE